MIGRDRNVLRALLKAKRGEMDEADFLLGEYEDVQFWTDRPEPATYALAMRAARIDLTVDFEAELEVLGTRSHVGLTSLDVLLPNLRSALDADQYALESTRAMAAFDVGEPEHLGRFVDDRLAEDLGEDAAGKLRQLARRRWNLAAGTSFLGEAAELATRPEQTPLEASILGILALFSSHFELEEKEIVLFAGPRGLLVHLLTKTMGDRALRIDQSHAPQVERVLLEGVGSELARLLHTGSMGSGGIAIGGGVRLFEENDRPLLIYLMTPNPLEQIVHELAGYTSEAR